MMQLLDNTWKALKLVGAARELAIETRRLNWDVAPGTTFYLQAEHADIRLATHDLREIRAKVELQAGFGWQLLADQDDAGVYIIVRRKPLIGSIGRSSFYITLPDDLHLSLQLENCRLCLDDLTSRLELPPFALK
jgi:hypothetical protein